MKDQLKEIQFIVDEYCFFDLPEDLRRGFAAKSGWVITTLVTILLNKNLITLEDFKGLLSTHEQTEET